MKRLMKAMLVLIVLVLAFAIPAASASYTRTFNYDFVYPYDEVIRNGSGTIVFSFDPMDLGILPTAYSGINLGNSTSGRVLAFIAQHGDEARSSESNNIVNNMVYCSISLQWMNYATKASHFALKKENGISNSWDYTYVSSTHQASSQEAELWAIAKGNIE